MLGGYANAPGMAYLEANGWSLRKTVYIWGRSVENVEWALRGAFIKKHGYHRCARIGLFTDRLLLRRIQRRGFDAPSARRIGTDSFACGAQRICANRGDLWETLCADGAKNWRVICFPTDRRSTQKQKGNTIGVCIIRTRIILKNTNLANQSNDY